MVDEQPRTEDRAGSTATSRTDGLRSLSTSPTPVIVPPVPTPATKRWTAPSVWLTVRVPGLPVPVTELPVPVRIPVPGIGLPVAATGLLVRPKPGGGQFYTSFASAGQPGLAVASVLYLRYYVKFPAGFDFGRGGKLPGLYGGSPGQASGGHHGQAFSTRCMWRNHPAGSLSNCSSAVACAEVYVYGPQISQGYGLDVGGTWNWPGDDRWHMIEQRVDRANGDITVWYDGVQVLSTTGALGGAASVPFSGIMFSTFFGGHDTTWGPSKDENAYFADFAVSTSYIGKS